MNAVSLLFALAVIGVGAFAVYGFVRDAKRRAALVSYCASQGWTYVAEDDSFAGRWHGTPFGEGTDPRARDVVTGADRGRPFAALDYTYVTESTDSKGHTTRSTHHVAVVSIGLPVWLPGVQVVPDGMLHRAVEAFGVGAGIQLESEDFNRRFTVTAQQPKFASDVITPRTMESLLAAPPTAWRIEGSDIVSWRSGAIAPVDILERLAVLHRVVDGIPGFVWRDNGYVGNDAASNAAPNNAAPYNPAPTNEAPAPSPIPPAEGSAP